MRADACAGQVVHIGDDTEMTLIHDLAAMVSAAVGVTKRVQPAPAPPGSVQVRSPDITRLRRLVGFEPATPLEEGLALTWAWYSGIAEREERLATSSA